MRYLVAAGTLILSILIVIWASASMINWVSGADDEEETVHVGETLHMPGPPVGVLVSATPTPTPAPTPVASSVVLPPLPNPAPAPPPAVTSGCTTEIICAYPWDCATAMRIVSCETGGTFSPNVVGAAGERGCFQIHSTHWGKPQCNPDLLFDPAYNAACAYSIYAGDAETPGSGWQPWSCY